MRDQLDQILDEAVKSYAAVEPPPDLPARILRQAQQEPARQRAPWKLALAFALPVVAALALAFVFAGRLALPTPPASIASVPGAPDVAIHPHPQPHKLLAAATGEPLQNHRHAHKATGPRSWARPLPAPYSKEELALLNFVKQHPKEAAEVAEAQKHGLTNPPPPITITPLHTEPLTIAALKLGEPN